MKSQVKCDESRPFCHRCTDFGRVCGGYTAQGTWVIDIDAARQRWCSPPSMVQPNSTGNSVEQRAFSYYIERTAPRLEGFMFEARGFFSTVVPQVGQSELAVTHMVIALATIHEALSVQFQVSNTQRRLFYFHHNRAAKLLINNDTLPSIEIVLIVCLLFLACENFQGSVINGSKHVRSGLRMLDDWNHRVSHPSSLMADIVRRAIKPIFGRLSEQIPVLGTSSLMLPATTVSRTTCNLAGALTASHLENAQDELVQIMQEITQSLPKLPPTPEKKSRIIELAGELSRWYQALQRTKVDLATENAVVIDKIEELLIHVRVLLIILHTGDSPIEAVYDAFLVDFRLICADIERLINSRPTADDESRHETDRSLPKSRNDSTIVYRCLSLSPPSSAKKSSQTSPCTQSERGLLGLLHCCDFRASRDINRRAWSDSGRNGS